MTQKGSKPNRGVQRRHDLRTGYKLKRPYLNYWKSVKQLEDQNAGNLTKRNVNVRLQPLFVFLNASLLAGGPIGIGPSPLSVRGGAKAERERAP